MSTTTSNHYWLKSQENLEVDSLCLGTGRFLRSVLVPVLVDHGFQPALIQTRGRTFMEYMKGRSSGGSYEVDTVLASGDIETAEIPCWGAFSLGQEGDKQAFYEMLPEISSKTKGISIIGVGVTEAGLSSQSTPVMKHLYELLKQICQFRKAGTWPSEKKVCVIDMDNVPNNGNVIMGYMNALAEEEGDESFSTFVKTQVVFLNTMVDRITSQREGSNGLVPRCEPTPSKALVVLDPHGDWPIASTDKGGVVVRSTQDQLNVDIALKLRIANGTHTAIAHTLALTKCLETSQLSSSDDLGTLFIKDLDVLFEGQILPGAMSLTNPEDVKAVYEDWRRRLVHPHFGLSSFFITQNGPAKGGIRWGPTIIDLVEQKEKQDDAKATPLKVSFAFAYAVLLRWLTPVADDDDDDDNKKRKRNVDHDATTVYTGWLEQSKDGKKPTLKSKSNEGSETYADGLRYHLEQGWYEYKCPIIVEMEGTMPLVESLQSCVGKSPENCAPAVRAYLLASNGGNLQSVSKGIDDLVQAIAILYARLVSVADDGGLIDVLKELAESKNGIGLETPCVELAKTVFS